MNNAHDAISLDSIRPEVRARSSYPRFEIDHVQHRLQWNENPTEFPEKIKQEILRRLSDLKWSDYPQFQPYALMDQIAALNNIGSDQVVISNGSSSLLRTIFWATIQTGDAVVVPSPTFLQYNMLTEVCGGTYHDIPFVEHDAGFALPTDQLIDLAQTKQAKLLVICAPANPTGTVIPAADIERIAAECGCLLVLDEAYAHFSRQDLAPLLAKYNNLILVRTMSKAFAMAGVRSAYLLASPELATEFNKLMGAFPLDHFSTVATQVALENLDYISQSTNDLIAERNRLTEALDEIPGTKVYPSGTNFILVRVGDQANALTDKLLQDHSLLISNMASYPQLAGCVRISVGTRIQNELVVAEMGKFLE